MEQKPLVFSTGPKDALDKIQFFQGQRAGRELWADKPRDVQDRDLESFNKGIDLAKDYILKLENEVLELRKQRAELRLLTKKLSDKTKEELTEAFKELLVYAEAEYLCGLPNPSRGAVKSGIIKMLAEKRGIQL